MHKVLYGVRFVEAVVDTGERASERDHPLIIGGTRQSNDDDDEKRSLGCLTLMNDDYEATLRVPVERRPGHWTAATTRSRHVRQRLIYHFVRPGDAAFCLPLQPSRKY